MSFFIDWLRQAVALTSENKHNFEKFNAGCYEKTYTTATNSQVLFNLDIDTKPKDHSTSSKQPSDERKSDTSSDILLDSYLEQFQFNPVTECPFVYHEGNSQTFECVLLVSKLATRHYKIKNLFPGDETVVYFTTIPRDNPALIAFMEFALKKAMCIESFSIMGSNGSMILDELSSMTNSKKNTNCSQAKLLQETALQYMSNCQFKDLSNKLNEFFSTKLYAPDKTQYEIVNRDFNLDIYRKLCEILNIDASDSIRWKNEFCLYNIVKKHYSDAIYQFRAPWLGQQSLDIFIPSLNVGIEYQGIQHYESIELFGGKEGLQARKINDEKKKMKCQKNNVLLLEWPYSDKVSDGNLQAKFNNLGLQIPSSEIIELSTEGTDPSVAAIEYLSKALRNNNLANKLYSIREFAKNNEQLKIKEVLCDAIVNFSQHKSLIFFSAVLEYNAPAIYNAICSDEKLLEYWINTGILNFYGRKIVFTLENQKPGSSDAAYYLKKIRNVEKKKGKDPNTRFINNLIKSEAEDNGISEARIKDILSKSY